MLTVDTISLIFSYLSLDDILTVSQVCKQWNKLVNTDQITRYLYPIIPDRVRNGLVIEKSREDNIVVLYRYDSTDVGVNTIWKRYFPDYPKLTGSLIKNIKLIHYHVYPEIYIQAAFRTCIDRPIKNCPNILWRLTQRKKLAQKCLGCNISEIREIYHSSPDRECDLEDCIGVFWNIPRKAYIIPYIIGPTPPYNIIVYEDGREVKDYHWSQDTILGNVLFESYEDPDYENDVKYFYANYPQLINWKKKTIYKTLNFNERFILSHINLWHLWDWGYVFKYVHMSKETKRKIRWLSFNKPVTMDEYYLSALI